MVNGHISLERHKSFTLSVKYRLSRMITNEPHRDKTNKMADAPSEDSDKPGHPPSLIRVSPVRLMGS